MNFPAFLVCSKHWLRSCGPEKSLRQIYSAWSKKPAMMQKEHVSRYCGWGTCSINTSKAKSYPITIKEHIEITSWMSYHQFTLGVFFPPPSDSMWQNERRGRNLQQDNKPQSTLHGLTSHFLPPVDHVARWQISEWEMMLGDWFKEHREEAIFAS